MKQILTALPLILAGSLAAADGYDPFADRDTVWVLQVLNGEPFEADTTMNFAEPGRVAGKASCNNFSGPLLSDYPEFEIGMMISTRMACPDMESEQVFLDALATMKGIVATEEVLYLTGPDGNEMIFTPAE